MELPKRLLVTAIRAVRSLRSPSRSIIVFAPESFGSVGDQAMMEVVRQRLVSRDLIPTFVYMPAWSPIPLRVPARSVVLQSFSNFSIQFWRLVSRARAVMVIGADVVDGVYDNTLPLRWIGKLRRAREAGCKVAIINFSFSKDGDPVVLRELRVAESFRFFPRDPVSYGRFTSLTDQEATLTADLAFLMAPELRAQAALEAEQWLRARKDAGQTILFVNLSGHTLSRMAGDGIAAMTDALSTWLQASSDRSVFLVPHDFRPAPTGDIEALEKLYECLAIDYGDRTGIIKPPFAAWDIKALCKYADFAISGRMHLSIACLGMGVPVISVVYVGKFEGLMNHIGLADEDLLISTEEALHADVLSSKIDNVFAERGRLSKLIQSNLESVQRLSEENLHWL